MADIQVPFRDGMLSFHIPGRCPADIVSPVKLTLPQDPLAVVRAALERPIGTPPLSRIVRPGQKVAVMIDDVSRETPAGLILPPLLELLTGAGIARKEIRIIIALGTHRPMKKSEILAKVGRQIAEAYEILNLPCWDTDQMVYMGRSSNGIPAWINRHVAEADIRIGLGMITPHMDTGFSGGAKIILPGTCSRETVEAFHRRQAQLSDNQLGVMDSPMRLDLEAFVGERVGLDFIVNVVLDGGGAIYRCVAGDFVEAHRAGVTFAKEAYGVPVPRRYPFVVSNAFPGQIDLWQSTKAIASGELMTADGGTLVLLAACPEGAGSHPRFVDYIGKDQDQLLAMLESGGLEDPVAAAIAVPLSRIRKRIRIALVSPGLSKSDAERMGFAYHVSVESALSAQMCAHHDEALPVGIMTHGGVCLPLLDR